MIGIINLLISIVLWFLFGVVFMKMMLTQSEKEIVKYTCMAAMLVFFADGFMDIALACFKTM